MNNLFLLNIFFHLVSLQFLLLISLLKREHILWQILLSVLVIIVLCFSPLITDIIVFNQSINFINPYLWIILFWFIVIAGWLKTPLNYFGLSLLAALSGIVWSYDVISLILQQSLLENFSNNIMQMQIMITELQKVLLSFAMGLGIFFSLAILFLLIKTAEYTLIILIQTTLWIVYFYQLFFTLFSPLWIDFIKEKIIYSYPILAILLSLLIFLKLKQSHFIDSFVYIFLGLMIPFIINYAILSYL